MHDLSRHSQPGTTESVVAFGDPRGRFYEWAATACLAVGLIGGVSVSTAGHENLAPLWALCCAGAVILLEKRDRQARKRGDEAAQAFLEQVDARRDADGDDGLSIPPFAPVASGVDKRDPAPAQVLSRLAGSRTPGAAK